MKTTIKNGKICLDSLQNKLVEYYRFRTLLWKTFTYLGKDGEEHIGFNFYLKKKDVKSENMKIHRARVNMKGNLILPKGFFRNKEFEDIINNNQEVVLIATRYYITIQPVESKHKSIDVVLNIDGCSQ